MKRRLLSQPTMSFVVVEKPSCIHEPHVLYWDPGNISNSVLVPQRCLPIAIRNFQRVSWRIMLHEQHLGNFPKNCKNKCREAPAEGMINNAASLTFSCFGHALCFAVHSAFTRQGKLGTGPTSGDGTYDRGRYLSVQGKTSGVGAEGGSLVVHDGRGQVTIRTSACTSANSTGTVVRSTMAGSSSTNWYLYTAPWPYFLAKFSTIFLSAEIMNPLSRHELLKPNPCHQVTVLSIAARARISCSSCKLACTFSAWARVSPRGLKAVSAKIGSFSSRTARGHWLVPRLPAIEGQA